MRNLKTARFKMIFVVWIFARILMRSRSTKKIVKLLRIRLLFQELYLWRRIRRQKEPGSDQDFWQFFFFLKFFDEIFWQIVWPIFLTDFFDHIFWSMRLLFQELYIWRRIRRQKESGSNQGCGHRGLFKRSFERLYSIGRLFQGYSKAKGNY